jgi:single-stranded DNA-binding protein
MTLHASFYGAVFKDAEVKESKSGNRYASVLIAVPNGTDAEGREQSLFLKVFAFQELTDEAASLRRGDRAYIEGTLDAKIWQSERGPKLDLTVKASHLRKTRTAKDKASRSQSFAPKNPAIALHHTRQAPQAQGRDDYWRDELPI